MGGCRDIKVGRRYRSSKLIELNHRLVSHPAQCAFSAGVFSTPDSSCNGVQIVERKCRVAAFRQLGRLSFGLALAEEEGYELSDEEIEGISGGNWSCWTVCDEYDPYYCYANDPGPR